VSGSEVPRLESRRLEWDLRPEEALRLVRADAHPVALFGTWASGSDVVTSEPLLTRGATEVPPSALGEVLDAPCPPGPGSGPGPGPEPGPGPGPRPGPAHDHAGPPFGGGWIGYLGYSAAGEALPPTGERRLPAWWFGYYDHVLRHDQASGEWFFEALWTAARADALERRFAELSRRATRTPPHPREYTCGPFLLTPAVEAHKAAVGQTVEYIRQGDIFQANICLRTEADFDGDPLDAFCQAVTVLSPPYAAFIAPPGGAVASMSPELFLRRTAETVVSQPIKGTSHRSSQPDQASAQRDDLESSAKNRAENVMIVDLVRNDLSRVCDPGSVTVPRLLAAEPHPGVWHLVSEVRGTLAQGAGDGDLIRAAFPPGSVTGAPKVRALEVIDELETAPREVYTGAIGYRSPVAGLELNVAIRTFEFAAGRVWLGVGGGIVADSVPDDEYAECLIKVGPLIAAIGSKLDTGQNEPIRDVRPRPAAGVFTSLLVTDGETAGLDAHLERLAASTRQLYGKDLPDSLHNDLAACLAKRPTGRLRITVRPVGGPLQAHVEVVPLPPGPPPSAVRLHPVTVQGGLGAHKWLDRRLLADLTRAAASGPSGQLLLIDSEGELLETDRGNVFAVIDGELRTPPADGRILPGTTRDAIVRAAREDGIACRAEPLTLADLAAATEIFVSNAVYSVLPVGSVDGCPQTWDLGPVTKHFELTLASRPTRGEPAPASGQATGHASHFRTLARQSPAARPAVILVDNYDSFTYNLAHLLTEAGCQVEVVRNDEVPASEVTGSGAAGVVISPGPCAPPEAGISVDVVRGCAGQIPLLGICLGHQAIAAAFGASVIRAPHPVHGKVCQVTHDGRGVLAGLPQGFQATRYHSLIVDEDSLPPALVITARSGPIPMGLRHVSCQVEGVQFHPESILTPHGEAIIRNFAQAACRTTNRGDSHGKRGSPNTPSGYVKQAATMIMGRCVPYTTSFDP
jgi:para-aminobenzoate synthetase / 4-amino-4-deoxychorismate lyase